MTSALACNQPFVAVAYRDIAGVQLHKSWHWRQCVVSVRTLLADALSDDAIKRAQQLDEDDHNTLGALQLVTKALEVCFMLITISRVRSLDDICQERRWITGGIFLDPFEVWTHTKSVNPLLWTSPIPPPNGYQPRRVRTFKLYIFAVVAFLTILTNLMEPATAILVLPTLQWADTRHVLEQRFNEIGTASPPGLSGASDFLGCNADDLSAHNYSCTSDVYGTTLDEWATSIVAAGKQASLPSGKLFRSSASQERSLQFSINPSEAGDLTWIPNRQALAGLSVHFEKFYNLSHGLESNKKSLKGYNNSLQTILNLQGPAIGLDTTFFRGSLIDIEISKDKHAICYSGWRFDDISEYQKCFPWGKHWDIPNSQSRLFIGAPNSAIHQS